MASLKRNELARQLARWNPETRLLLLFGRDESSCREAGNAAVAALGDAADPMAVADIAPADLRGNPGLLADEAASVPMFGGNRVLRVAGAGEESLEAVRLLLGAPVAGNPVVMLGGDLAKTSGLRKLAEESPLALAVVFWPLEGRDLDNWLAREAQDRGLKLEQGAAERLILASGGDVGILASELDKFALFLDASVQNQKRLDAEALAALGADSAEEDVQALMSAVVAGNRGATGRQLHLLADSSAIPALRALARRLMQMTEIRAAMDGGVDARSAVKALRPPIYPFREQDALAAAMPHWPLPRIRAGLAAMLEAERRIKAPGSPGDRCGWQAILGLMPDLGGKAQNA